MGIHRNGTFLPFLRIPSGIPTFHGNPAELMEEGKVLNGKYNSNKPISIIYALECTEL